MTSLSESRSKLVLPINVFKISGARFSQQQFEKLVKRTNSKLRTLDIEIQIKDFQTVASPQLAFVSDENVETVVKNYQTPGELRVFLVREYKDVQFYSWTYDPVRSPEVEAHWHGAIFITDAWSDNDGFIYKFRGFPESSDTLLHELGHVLMQRDAHDTGIKPNFFSGTPALCDDTIEIEQARLMRSGPYLVREESIRP